MRAHEPVRLQRIDEWPQVRLAAVGSHVEFIDDEIPQFRERPRLLKQLPYVCADRVEAVVDARVEIEEDGFASELAGRVVRDSPERVVASKVDCHNL